MAHYPMPRLHPLRVVDLEPSYALIVPLLPALCGLLC